jgi:hypothetical protein
MFQQAADTTHLKPTLRRMNCVYLTSKTGTMIAKIPSFVGIGPYALNEDGHFVAFSNATVPSLINVFDVDTKKII